MFQILPCVTLVLVVGVDFGCAEPEALAFRGSSSTAAGPPPVRSVREVTEQERPGLFLLVSAVVLAVLLHVREYCAVQRKRVPGDSDVLSPRQPQEFRSRFNAAFAYFGYLFLPAPVRLAKVAARKCVPRLCTREAEPSTREVPPEKGNTPVSGLRAGEAEPSAKQSLPDTGATPLRVLGLALKSELEGKACWRSHYGSVAERASLLMAGSLHVM